MRLENQGFEQRDLARGFEHGQPVVGRRRRDADVAREVGLVQQVGRAERARAQEALEVAQAADVGERPDVAFEIGRQVRGVERHGVDVGGGVLIVHLDQGPVKLC